jgi:8-oxo-dGTP pyrophosphatase MutT (NUDIX family)
MPTSEFLDEPKVAAWRRSLEDAGCTIREIKPLSLLHRQNGELLFALLEADVRGPDGRRLVPYVFIRGHACIVVALIRNAASGEERFLMVEQRRIGHGALCLEFPAGMLDRDIDNPAGVALRELREETGLEIPPHMLKPLCDRPLHSSPGATDEGIYYYGCVAEVSDKEFRRFEGSLRGAEEENERIRVTLKTREEAEKDLMSLQARLGFFLFEQALPQMKHGSKPS